MSNSNGEASQAKATFNELLERDRSDGTTEKADHAIVPLSPESKRRILPKVHRRLAEVDVGLIDLFRELVAGERPWPLLLWGKTGVGKTRASLCLCDLVEDSVYYPIGSLRNNILANQIVETRAAWAEIKEARLAVLDELPAEVRADNVDYTTVRHFANLRELYGNSVAIFISNLRPEELSEIYDNSLMSRLLCGTVHELLGPDRRRHK